MLGSPVGWLIDPTGEQLVVRFSRQGLRVSASVRVWIGGRLPSAGPRCWVGFLGGRAVSFHEAMIRHRGKSV
eukprot:4391849-Lingulodinium_polyedra.AAC.1